MHALNNQVAFITGAGGALGGAVAHAFAQAGARLALADVRLEAVQRTAEALALPADHVLTTSVDLTQAASVQSWVDEAHARFGRADILVNIAGGYKAGVPVHELSETDWDFMFNLNARTAFLACRAVVPHMLAQGGGKIINVGARGGLVGGKNSAAYAVAKSAVHRLTESLSAELRERNINVNAVLPSIIDTPANRASMPNANFGAWVSGADLANVLVFLASEASRAIHGALIPVYGLS